MHPGARGAGNTAPPRLPTPVPPSLGQRAPPPPRSPSPFARVGCLVTVRLRRPGARAAPLLPRGPPPGRTPAAHTSACMALLVRTLSASAGPSWRQAARAFSRFAPPPTRPASVFPRAMASRQESQPQCWPPARSVATSFDYLVIGGGSGGLASARRAAELGARAAVVESHKLGGTCVSTRALPVLLLAPRPLQHRARGPAFFPPLSAETFCAPS